MEKKTIGILEDNHSLRQNIERYLTAMQSYDIAFSHPGIGALTKTEPAQPDYILLDVHLNDSNGLEHISEMKQRFPDTSVIIMTGDNSDQLIMQAFENGASAYIYKPFKLAEITETFKKLETDGSYMQPAVATKLIGMLKKRDVIAELQVQFDLTERETEIIRCMKDGLSYKQIGERLFISHHTVNHHLKNVYLKMDVTSRNELVATYFTQNKNH
ncbi:MAG: response regulator transcription factor [Chitinophagales bacterium]|nr:response regulator transcription factor [Chitinophagales bacterium]